MDDLDGSAALDDELADSYHSSTDLDDPADALRVLVRARRILKDAKLMTEIKGLMAEQRRAVGSAKEEN